MFKLLGNLTQYYIEYFFLKKYNNNKIFYQDNNKVPFT